jgi:hypothetical protein
MRQVLLIAAVLLALGAGATRAQTHATDEGAPGERMPISYGAYVRDLDGNKLCFFDMKLG